MVEAAVVQPKDVDAKAGEIWMVGDRFVLGIGDHEDGGHDKLFAWIRKNLTSKAWQPDILYSDLPWTDGIAVQFRRYAEAGMPSRFDTIGTRGSVGGFLPPLLRIMAHAALAVRGDVYMEMGLANEQLTIDIMESEGLHFIERWGITYLKKNPAVLLQFNKNPKAAVRAGSAEGMDDDKDTIVWAAERSIAKPGWVYDLCTGKGCTPKAITKSTEHRFCGLELRPSAATETIQKVMKVLKMPARKVGAL